MQVFPKLNDVTLNLVLALETDVVTDSCYSRERRVGLEKML
jgi:hypothetical protein